MLLFSFLLIRYDWKLNMLFSLQDPLNVYICADGSNYTGLETVVGFSDKLLMDLKDKHFQNMADFKDTSIQFISMTSLVRNTVAHFTRPSFWLKTNNQPLKKFLTLAFTWVKVVKNWTSIKKIKWFKSEVFKKCQ